MSDGRTQGLGQHVDLRGSLLVEFCLNPQTQGPKSTGLQDIHPYGIHPLTYGHHPVSPMDLFADTNRVCVESVSRFSHRLETIYKRAKLHLSAANEKYKARYDRLHRPVHYTEDDLVLLSTRHLHLRGTPDKLQRKFVGPFRVTSRIGDQAYQLALPDDWRIHNVFHVSLLKPWRGEWRELEDAPAPELESDEDDEYEIERVLRWRYYRVGNQRKKEYLIVRKGYPLDDAEWVPFDEMTPRANFRNMIERDQPVEDTGGGSTV